MIMVITSIKLAKLQKIRSLLKLKNNDWNYAIQWQLVHRRLCQIGALYAVSFNWLELHTSTSLYQMHVSYRHRIV